MKLNLTGEKVEEVLLTYFKKDNEAILAYLCFILKKIDDGQKIPARVIKKLLAYFDKPFAENVELLSDFLESTKNQVLQNIRKLKGYDFAIMNPIPDNRQSFSFKNFDFRNIYKPQFSLEDFLNEFFERLHSFPELEKLLLKKAELIKEDFIVYSFTKMYEYMNKMPEEKRLTSYKQRVIIGILCAEFGILLSEREFNKHPKLSQHYREYLQDQVKHFCLKAERQIKIRSNPGVKTGIEK